MANTPFMEYQAPGPGSLGMAWSLRPTDDEYDMSKGDTIHKIMSGSAAIASLRSREMELEVRRGRP